MFLKFPVGSILFAGAMVIAAAGGASAENWYVISASRNSAVLMDADSRKTAPVVTLNARVLHPGIREYQKHPIIASQFTFEFDCKANRMRTIAFSAVDVDGRTPEGLSSDKVREWSAIAEKDGAAVFKAFACDGTAPPEVIGRYKDFTDIESKYLMWLGDPDAGDFAHWKIAR